MNFLKTNEVMIAIGFSLNHTRRVFSSTNRAIEIASAEPMVANVRIIIVSANILMASTNQAMVVEVGI